MYSYLNDGADVNIPLEIVSAKSRIELTLLHLAVLTRSQVFIMALLGKGADIEAKIKITLNNESAIYVEISPLMLAATIEKPDLTELLLMNGADSGVKNPVGVRRRIQAEATFSQLIALSNDVELNELLRQKLHLHAKCETDVEFWLHSEVSALDVATVLDKQVVMDILAHDKPTPWDEDFWDPTKPNHATTLGVLLAAALGNKGFWKMMLMKSAVDINAVCKVKMQAIVAAQLRLLHRAYA